MYSFCVVGVTLAGVYIFKANVRLCSARAAQSSCIMRTYRLLARESEWSLFFAYICLYILHVSDYKKLKRDMGTKIILPQCAHKELDVQSSYSNSSQEINPRQRCIALARSQPCSSSFFIIFPTTPRMWILVSTLFFRHSSSPHSSLPSSLLPPLLSSSFLSSIQQPTNTVTDRHNNRQTHQLIGRTNPWTHQSIGADVSITNVIAMYPRNSDVHMGINLVPSVGPFYVT